jgi:hypothetical protein
VSLVVNNLIIWIFVHNQTKKKLRKNSVRVVKAPSETSDSNDEEGEQQSVLSMSSSFRTAPVLPQRPSEDGQLLDRRSQLNQDQRLKLVSSQAFLFVGCYFISNIWTYILRLYEAQATIYVEEMELPYHNYTMLILQASLLPLQGLFNMMVYVRPKYLKNRVQFPKETKLWAVRRAIIGTSVDPLHEDSGENKIEAEGKKTKSQVKQTKHSQGMVSSMTANSNDDSPKSERKQAQALNRPDHTKSFTNSLDVIIELESESKSLPSKVELSQLENVGRWFDATQDTETNADLIEETSDNVPLSMMDGPPDQVEAHQSSDRIPTEDQNTSSNLDLTEDPKSNTTELPEEAKGKTFMNMVDICTDSRAEYLAGEAKGSRLTPKLSYHT